MNGDLCPHKDDPLMAGAWVSALRVALETPMIVTEFERATGMRYSAPKTPLDSLIDAATGHGETYVEAFIRWFNENVWGEV